ncbi:MAG: FliM/FliN family flagellar motor switch protein [Acidimicrobiales bacterium]
MTDTSAGTSANPFEQSRLLTSERAQLFNRTAETMAQRFEDGLSRWLSDVSVGAAPVEQIDLISLATGLNDLAVIKSQYQMTHGIIASDLCLSLSIVAMLCGGVADPPPEARPLSRLEMGVYDLVLQPLLDLTVELFEIGPTELGSHTSSEAGLPDDQMEPAIAVPMTITAGGAEGAMVVAMSASQLQTYSEEVDRRIAGLAASKNDEPNVQIIRAVQPVVVELIAGFEPLQVPARQLVDLQIGDVIRTRQSISRPLIARVGGERLFHIRAAQRGQRLVAELTGHADGANRDLGATTRGQSPRPLGGGTR